MNVGRKRTDMAIILATDDVARAGAPTDTNDFDGRASQAHENVQALNNDAEQTKDLRRGGVRGL